MGVTEDLPDCNRGNDRVQTEVEHDQESCDPDRFLEAFEENYAQAGKKNESYAHLAF